jgi:uncharacterized RDD family membrane protein YckC
MSYFPSISQTSRRIVITVAVLLSWATAAGAQPRADSEPHAVRLARTALAVERALTQEQPEEERRFRFNRDIVRIGQNFTVREGESVGQIHSGLADITIAGQVEDDVVVVVGSLHLMSTAKVGGSVVVVGGTLTVDSGAAIERDMVVMGGSLSTTGEFAPGGQQVVVGNLAVAHTLQAFVPWIMRGLLFGRPLVPDIAWMWVVVAIFFFIYLMVNALFANPVRVVADSVTARPLSSFLLGLLVLVLAIPAIAILAATVLGIAVVPFVLCGLVIGALIGKAGVMRATGRSVVPEEEDAGRVRALVSLAIGFAVLTIAYMIPVLGFITWAITGAIGMGGAASAFRGALRREHPPRVRPPLPAEAAPMAESVAAGAREPAYAASAPVNAFVPETGAPVEAGAGASLPPPSAAGPADLAVYPRASFLDRVAAFALDAVLVAIAVNLLDLSRHDGWFPLLLVAYHVAFWAWRGTTLGGIVIGLRVIRVQGTDLRFPDALVRGLSGIFSIAALGIGCFWMLQDPEKQMWHDKIAGTLVVKVPRHLVLP